MRAPAAGVSLDTSSELIALERALNEAKVLEALAHASEASSSSRSSPPQAPAPADHHLQMLIRHSTRAPFLAVALIMMAIALAISLFAIACCQRKRKVHKKVTHNPSQAATPPRMPPNRPDGELVLELVLEHAITAGAISSAPLETRSIGRKLPRLASMVGSRWAPRGLARRAQQAREGREAYARRQARERLLYGAPSAYSGGTAHAATFSSDPASLRVVIDLQRTQESKTPLAQIPRCKCPQCAPSGR